MSIEKLKYNDDFRRIYNSTGELTKIISGERQKTQGLGHWIASVPPDAILDPDYQMFEKCRAERDRWGAWRHLKAFLDRWPGCRIDPKR